MKYSVLILVLCTMLFSCNNQSNREKNQSNQATSEKISPENLEVITISVVGMTCEGCERTVQTAVGQLPGIQEVKASYLDSTTVVAFDKTQVDFGKIKAALEEKGYEALSYKVGEQE